MDDHDLAIAAEMKIELYRIDAEFRSPAESIEAVFGPEISGATMADYFHHDAVFPRCFAGLIHWLQEARASVLADRIRLGPALTFGYFPLSIRPFMNHR